jgi:hypothetical protein
MNDGSRLCIRYGKDNSMLVVELGALYPELIAIYDPFLIQILDCIKVSNPHHQVNYVL